MSYWVNCSAWWRSSQDTLKLSARRGRQYWSIIWSSHILLVWSEESPWSDASIQRKVDFLKPGSKVQVPFPKSKSKVWLWTGVDPVTLNPCHSSVCTQVYFEKLKILELNVQCNVCKAFRCQSTLVKPSFVVHFLHASHVISLERKVNHLYLHNLGFERVGWDLRCGAGRRQICRSPGIPRAASDHVSDVRVLSPVTGWCCTLSRCNARLTFPPVSASYVTMSSSSFGK